MATSPPPPVTLDLVWQGDLRFAGRADGVELVLDGAKAAGPSPVQALGFALAGCMAIDVAQIGERRSEEPRRFVTIDLHFVVTGEVAPEKVERALALSREKYCSVWHSLRQDIEFRTSFEIEKRRSP